MKLSLEKGFLLILMGGGILLAMILMGDPGFPASLQILRIILGVVYVLLIPGYMLQSALFPKKTDLDLMARAAFSFGLSISILPPIFLILNTLGSKVQFWSVALALFIFVNICAIVALVRRRRLADDEKAELTISLNYKYWWAMQDRFSRWVYAALAFSFITAVISGILVSQEAPAEPFTEFFLLDSQGLSMDYPREVTAGTQVFCMLAIVNHEGQPSEYRIVAVEGEDQVLSASEPISLMDGETWQGYLTIVLAQMGDGQKVEFFLERIGSPWPYRTLRIWINVRGLEEKTSGITAGILFLGGWGRESSSRSLRG